jgi:hypothetical protein
MFMLVVALLSAAGLIWRHVRQKKSTITLEEAEE